MQPQRKIMIVETTRAFVKLNQAKAAVSAGGIKFIVNLSVYKVLLHFKDCFAYKALKWLLPQ